MAILALCAALLALLSVSFYGQRFHYKKKLSRQRIGKIAAHSRELCHHNVMNEPAVTVDESSQNATPLQMSSRPSEATDEAGKEQCPDNVSVHTASSAAPPVLPPILEGGHEGPRIHRTPSKAPSIMSKYSGKARSMTYSNQGLSAYRS